jgi:hypothetical protein
LNTQFCITKALINRGFLDIESYQDMIDALSLMKLLQFDEKSIREGKVYNSDQVFSQLRKKISK